MLRKINSQASIQKPQLVKELCLCLLSAVLLILSFPKFNLEFLAWVGFVPLFFLLRDKSKPKAFLFSYLTGIIFWLGIIYWLVHVTLAGMIILLLYLALYFGMFGLVFSSIEHRASSIEYLFIPSLWVILEYIRSHLFTGFPWALLGYSQYLNSPTIQFADITGVWGVSFLVMMINVAIYLVTSRLPVRQAGKSQVESQKLSILRQVAPSIILLICVLSYGYYKLYMRPALPAGRQAASDLRQIRICVIQGNIPQEFKWDPEAKDYILEKYLNITRNVNKDKPDLIIWPEAALPVVLEEEPIFIEQVKKLAKEIKTPILLGVVNVQNDHYYNSALLISGEGEILTKYDKLHLVPFGEYIPFRKTLRFLETIVPIGDFTTGKEYTVFQTQASKKFSVLICFEDLFPELSREFIKKGADFLVNITNDAWFKKTSSPYQHLQASVFRAVENRASLVRAANTGVSGFIAPTGEILSLVQDKTGRNIFVDGHATQDINIPKKEMSFYTKYGDIFMIICLLFVLLGITPRKLIINGARPG